MRILITNYSLDHFGGSEIYVYDLALELQRRNHTPICYTPRPGRVAEFLIEKGVEVVSDLKSIESPDVIHSHHTPLTAQALAHFPLTPILFACLGPFHPLEQPDGITNSVSKFLALSKDLKQNLVQTVRLAPEQIAVIPNFVDTERFTAKRRVNVRPERVLLMSNYFRAEGVIEEACKLAGVLEIKQLGQYAESVWEVEKYLEWADLVITSAQGALRAMAMDRPVVVYRPTGSDGLITPANFEASRDCNFSGRAFSYHFSAEELAAQLLSYELPLVTEVAQKVRSEFSLKRVTTQLLELYSETIAAFHKRWPLEQAEERTNSILLDLAGLVAGYSSKQEAQDHLTAIINLRDREIELLRATLQKQQEEKIRLPSVLNFQLPASEIKRAIVKGIYYEGRGQSGCWTAGQISLMLEKPSAAKHFEFTFIVPDLPLFRDNSQSLEIVFNNLGTGTEGCLSPGAHKLVVNLPSKLGDQAQLVQVDIRINKPFVPFKIGLNADLRELGVQFMEAGFK